MPSILKPNVFFPGGYVYRQPETGFQLTGNMLLKENARLLLAHRKGNRLPRATLSQCIDDIVATACQRHPALCSQSQSSSPAKSFVKTVNASAPQPQQPRKVRKCGSCGGRKK